MAPGGRNASKSAADLGAREDIVPTVAEPEEARRHAPVVMLFLSPVADRFFGRVRALSHVRHFASTFAAGSVAMRLGKGAARESRCKPTCSTHSPLFSRLSLRAFVIDATSCAQVDVEPVAHDRHRFLYTKVSREKEIFVACDGFGALGRDDGRAQRA